MYAIIKYLSYFFLSIILIVLLILSFSLLVNRISLNKAEIFKGEVIYKMISLTECGMIRSLAENLIGNRCLSTESGNFVVSESDFKKAWPESPFDMEKKNYTMYVTLNSKLSVFGGYGPAKIIEINKLNKKPNRIK